MMLYPAMGELNARIHNRYMLVNVVARRARQIAEAYEEARQVLNEKPVTIAINEVADGILYDPENAPREKKNPESAPPEAEAVTQETETAEASTEDSAEAPIEEAAPVEAESAEASAEESETTETTVEPSEAPETETAETKSETE